LEEFDPMSVAERARDTGRILTDAQVQAFQKDGAVVVRGVLDDDWLAQLGGLVDDVRPNARSMNKYERDRGDGHERKEEDATFLSESNWLTHDAARRLVFDSPIVQVAAEGMRSNKVRLYEDLMMYRRAGSATPTVWHQDSPLWPMTGDQMCSVWFSLDAMTEKTGALRFVAGSHRGPAYMQYVPNARQAVAGGDAAPKFGEPMPVIEGREDQFDILTFDTEPADVILFSPKAIHATYGSHSERPKRSFSVRYLGDDIRWRVTPYGGFHRWMKELPLKDGDEMDNPRFPIVWPRA
jgi:ectoine hydroxylase-related dioxygenase (phytanoyl-CoA dioxygenase family)